MENEEVEKPHVVEKRSPFDIEVSLASDHALGAPGTVGVVTWNVDVDTIESAGIEFGLDTDYGMTAPVDLDAPDHRTLLLGMKPYSEYHFRIVVDDGTDIVASEDMVLSTGPATNLVNVDRFEVFDEEAHERGFMVTAYFKAGVSKEELDMGGATVFIMDADGDIVWWYVAAKSSIGRARMSEDGKNMWMINSGPAGALEWVTLDTLEGEVFELGASHDMTAVSGSTMAYLDYSESDCDSIFEIGPDGVPTEVFESEGVFESDQCHVNALRYSKTEDVYTLSNHRTDILVVNRDGEVEWRLSDIVPGGSNEDWGGAQHGHQLLDESILLFANSGGKGSTATEYAFDGTRIMHYDSGYWSYNYGDVQRLPGGNTLVTYSNAGVIQEIDPDGEVVMEIELNQTIGYVSWRRSLYGPPEDILL